MKHVVALILVVVLCFSLTVTAFAADYSSPTGGDKTGSTISPSTGSVAVVALAALACTAGGVSVVSHKNSKK